MRKNFLDVNLNVKQILGREKWKENAHLRWLEQRCYRGGHELWWDGTGSVGGSGATLCRTGWTPVALGSVFVEQGVCVYLHTHTCMWLYRCLFHSMRCDKRWKNRPWGKDKDFDLGHLPFETLRTSTKRFPECRWNYACKELVSKIKPRALQVGAGRSVSCGYPGAAGAQDPVSCPQRRVSPLSFQHSDTHASISHLPHNSTAQLKRARTISTVITQDE